MQAVITLTPDADPGRLKAELQGLGLWCETAIGPGGTPAALAVKAPSPPIAARTIEALPGVASVLTRSSPHPRLDAAAGRGIEVRRGDRAVVLGGGAAPVLAAGPCGAESEAQVHETAALVAAAGASMLRGGAFKPRTSPYAFRGHGRAALGWLRDAADAHGLLLVTEVMSETEVDAVAAHADLLQIGSRSMQSFALLRAAGAAGAPVMLKRGRAASLSEWRLAAEHLLDAGASGVIFCERGVMGVDPETRNTLDLGAVAVLKHVDGHVVMVDPSHAAGRRDLILPLAKAALAVGADGLLVETHPDARTARSDGAQALPPEALPQLAALLAAAGGAS